MTEQDDNFQTRFAGLQAELYSLLDTDPAAALARLDALDAAEFGKATLLAMRASFFIDAGGLCKDVALVTRGIEIFEHLITQYPDEENFKYNLANGLTAITDIEPYDDRGWYLKTSSLRQRAKTLYQHCADASSERDLQARAQTNLGNALLKAYRFVEAYDCYCRALESDPSNAIAATGAARVLLSYASAGIGDQDSLLIAANEHLRYARQNPHRLRELAGEHALEALTPLLQQPLPELRRPDFSEATPYQRFVRDYRLALSPTIEGFDLSLKRWDSLELPGIFEPAGTLYRIPTVFATFNVLKADYLAVRHLAFTALQDPPPESGSYADTLDYACYGIDTASLSLAQRTCVDVLDKLTVALLHYLGQIKPERNATFLNSFFEPGDAPKQWKARIREEIDCGNRGLLALAEMATDVSHQGYLQPKRQLRNASTHRFIVLHDISLATAPNVDIIDRYDKDEFRQHLIETLQLVRAALIYFVETVSDRERRFPVDNAWALDVPDHDWIRGEN